MPLRFLFDLRQPIRIPLLVLLNYAVKLIDGVVKLPPRWCTEYLQQLGMQFHAQLRAACEILVLDVLYFVDIGGEVVLSREPTFLRVAIEHLVDNGLGLQLIVGVSNDVSDLRLRQLNRQLIYHKLNVALVLNL